MRKLILLTGFILSFFPMAKAQYKTSPNGLKYILYRHNSSGKLPNKGDFITMNLISKTEDSVLENTFATGRPITLQLADPQFKGDALEGFRMMAVGDSALFLVSADSLTQGNLPPFLKSGSFLTFIVRMEDIKTPAEYAAIEKRAHDEMEKNKSGQAKKDSIAIESYLKAHKIKAKRTASGLYYVIDKKADGVQASAGKTVTVRYRGTLLDGTEFDKNLTDGISFPLGQHYVIQGWDEGIALLHKGEKAKLFIPSALAYGASATGTIPPNSPLVFEVELVEVK